jgi:hypothetical protein
LRLETNFRVTDSVVQAAWQDAAVLRHGGGEHANPLVPSKSD